MTTPSPIAEKNSSPIAHRAVRANPLVLAGGSALLLWIAFPPADRGYLGWIALVPLLSLVRREASSWRVFSASWVGGLVFGGLSMSWVAQADVVGSVLMALFMSLWWPLFLLPARLGVRRLRLPLMLVAPVAWVGLEYARSLILSGFPWYYLAHTQYANFAMIQMSDLLGAWGLSLLMVTANVLVLDLLTLPLFERNETGSRAIPAQKRKVAIVAGLVITSLIYGTARLATAHFRPGPRLALLQTDFPQESKNHPEMSKVLAVVAKLVARASAEGPRPDLIVWPETSYPIGLVRIDPTMSEAEFGRLSRAYDPGSTPDDWRDRQRLGRSDLPGMTDERNPAMMVGTITYDFGPSWFRRYNSAALFLPGAGTEPLGSYHKQALVVAGEYMPFLDAMPWLLKLTPYTDGYVPSLTPGPGPKILAMGGVRYAPIICFEDTIPALVRRAALEPGDSRPPDVLLNLTNDGWFRGSAEHQTHLAISVFRAVECRRPLARAVNTGISAVIDGNGRIVASLQQATEGVLAAEVPLDGRFSLYLAVGDVLAIVCLTAMAGIVVVGPFRARQNPLLAQGSSVG